jgi:hypothetical protein
LHRSHLLLSRGFSSARASVLSNSRTLRPRARPFSRFRGLFVRARVRSVDFADSSSACASVLSFSRAVRPRARPFSRFHGFFVRARVRSRDFAVFSSARASVLSNSQTLRPRVRPFLAICYCKMFSLCLQALGTTLIDIDATDVAFIMLPDSVQEGGRTSLSRLMKKGKREKSHEEVCKKLGLNNGVS